MQETFEFISDNALAGFRLKRLEIYNWGTFNGKIWKIEPEGYNSLLTGDIGSGKSTLVDAVTTLLVPHQKIIYNKAAGSTVRERDISSYFYGEYKNERNEMNNKGQGVRLRSENDFSVLLAVFSNTGFEQQVSLAQVFYARDGKIEKFFVFSQEALSIGANFTNFGTEILQLKKNLKKLPLTEVFENFKDYGQRFRNIFGIKSEKALDLFYQTVSMKSVGNLTEFVRSQMLEKTDVKERIVELRRNFENLTQSHEAILKAKRQLQQLEPLIAFSDEYSHLMEQLVEIEFSLHALPSVFAAFKKELLRSEQENISRQLAVLRKRIDNLKQVIAALESEKYRLKIAIDSNEQGKRLSEIDREIVRLEKSREAKYKNNNEYDTLAKSLDLKNVRTENEFIEQYYKALDLQSGIMKRSVDLDIQEVTLSVEKRTHEQAVKSDKDELDSLLKRKTQIPESSLRIRLQITEALGLNEEEIPFAGELIRVKEKEAIWEGAIERILHNFALSLLVNEDDYRRVSTFINSTDLKGRIVFYKVQDEKKKSFMNPSDISLLNKIDIKNDSPFYDWLRMELYEKFNYECCIDMEDFFRYPYAVTKEGQIKSGRTRHEKDDRSAITNRRNYVLGWSNKDKIKAFEAGIKKLNSRIDSLALEVENIRKEKLNLRNRENALRDLLRFEDYESLNYEADVTAIEKLKGEKEEIERSSDQLKTLRGHLEKVENELEENKKVNEAQIRNSGAFEISLENIAKDLTHCDTVAGLLKTDELKHYSEKIRFDIKGKALSLTSYDNIRDEAWRRYDSQRTEKSNKSKKQRDLIIKEMSRYKNDYPEDTTEVDPAVESIGEFRRMADKLKGDDLPKYERKFRELLNEKAIQDIALFKNQLELSCKDIKDKITLINRSLKDIEYEKGTFIELINSEASDNDIKDFRIMLRNAHENTLGQGDLYTEEKFFRVKEILDKFNSGEQADINWTNKVTDVRNWFIFSASEKWAEDKKEKEFFSDSSGKSGGQKEKLAYTILASALAYQFGLEWGVTRSRSFRFVVIDEAFGRGSDESTRYALELFAKMNLQLLIITPLQKINVIEDYIKSVHYVYNSEGKDSMIKSLTIEEYRKDKENYLLERVNGDLS
ncbi:MAG TPA: ATP-binding protein [Ignavibacteriales bacterium]|nr:ATP-binding protein [Ignavibacteriales bacterium]